jgi:hypothetical protein
MDVKKISASEVNRFCWCPWQWYYERVYGAAYLRKLAKERNEAMGWEPSGEDAFRRGRVFHENYVRRYTLKARLRLILAAVLIFAALSAFLFYKINA